MEDNPNKKKKRELFAPYADEDQGMTPEEVEKFMRDWPQRLKELEEKDKEKTAALEKNDTKE
ncbi:MAG: hypothetical protein G01um101429_677 [Parcubacteria group bacterium Gr01-1014_29]|nr:MAG: hypothetical protein G01um101429_677 [Parcubacteria group bacterium Gr01-1014_29]